MPSVFAFYRPRGIAGTYVVGIQLDLLPSESVQVWRDGSIQNPILKKHERSERHLYRIEQLIVGHSITIQINDKEMLPFQRTVYTAEKNAFRIFDVPCEIYNPHTRYNQHFGIITLNEIMVVDCDTDNIVIQQEESVVDALPVKQQEPDKRQHNAHKKEPTTRTRRHHIREKPVFIKPDPFASW